MSRWVKQSEHSVQVASTLMRYIKLSCVTSEIESSATRLKLGKLHIWSIYNSFRCPVTWSIRLLGAGPIPKTVWLPLAICVLPASAITSATRPRLIAVACKVSRSSSLLTCNATFACPDLSHLLKMGVFFFR
jgi:hypothetical protein